MLDARTTVTLCMAITCVMVLLIEPLALPERIRTTFAVRVYRLSGLILAVRLAFVVLVYAFFFAISWRPLYAAAATFSFHAIFTAISYGKFRFVREPLVFADIALLPALLRHKELFYANFVGILFWIASLLYVFGASALFYWLEPSLLPESNPLVWAVLGVMLATAPWLCMFIPPLHRRASQAATTLLGTGAPVHSTSALGTFAYVFLHFLSWIGFSAPIVARDRDAAVAKFATTQGDAHPVVLIWQSESFYDMRRQGDTDLSLPVLDMMRRRAARWGLLGSIFEGGYTLRTEFAAIAGVSPAEMGPDAYHPYLRPSPYVTSTWAAAFARAGWKTTFIHPYDRKFFHRHKAIPELGFRQVMMLDAFDQPPDGRYITDAELVERVMDVCGRGAEHPQYIFVASMENHGPWSAGRVDGASKPIDVYRAILQRTDTAIGNLLAGLDALQRPVWFVFYGDHAPLLDRFPHGFPEPRTDYVIIAAGTARSSSAGRHQDTQPWLLVDDLVASAIESRNEVANIDGHEK